MRTHALFYRRSGGAFVRTSTGSVHSSMQRLAGDCVICSRQFALLLIGIILFAISSASVSAEIIVKTDSLPTNPPRPATRSFSLRPDSSARLANRLIAPVDGTIVGIQVAWGSIGGLAASEETIALHILAGNGTQIPGAPVATIAAPVLVDGGANEFRFLDPTTSLVPLSIPISAGSDFWVALDLTSRSTGGGGGADGALMVDPAFLRYCWMTTGCKDTTHF